MVLRNGAALAGLARWRAEGDTGLLDRPSTAHRLPGKTTAHTEARVCELRTRLTRAAAAMATPDSAVRAGAPDSVNSKRTGPVASSRPLGEARP